MKGIQVTIGLGSNLDEPLQQIKTALASLAELDDCQLLAQSPIYKCKAMTLPQAQQQPDYMNAVALLETRLSAQKLLAQLQAIENQQGRERNERWGARTLDLDILTYGDAQINEADLHIPHVGIAQRNFVLYPLQAMMGEAFVIPGKGSIGDLIKRCTIDGFADDLVKCE